MAKEAAKGHAKVRQLSEGEIGAPIILLEEDHGSRAVQLQEALILERLHSDHRLRDIGLEGYVREQSPLPRGWSLQAPSDPKVGVSIAIGLVKQGEISSAEFMSLIHEDIKLKAVEHALEYDVSPGSEFVFDKMDRLISIGATSVPESSRRQIAVWLDQRSAHPENTAKLNAKIIARIQKDSNDEWIRNHVELVISPEKRFEMSIEEQIELLHRLRDTNQGSEDIAWVGDIDQYIAFLTARSAASEIMVREVEAIANDPATEVVAMVIGAGHSQKMAELLRKANRPFAVIRPDAMDNSDASQLSWIEFERHSRGLPAQPSDLAKLLVDAFPIKRSDPSTQDAPGLHKPKPVIQQEWFQAKSELSQFAELIGERMLHPGKAKQQSLGFNPNDLQGRMVYVDPRKIEIFDEDGALVALFPVELNPTNPSRHKTIWMKTRTRPPGEMGSPPPDERRMVEYQLQEALQEMQGPRRPRQTVDAAGGGDGKKPPRPGEHESTGEHEPGDGAHPDRDGRTDREHEAGNKDHGDEGERRSAQEKESSTEVQRHADPYLEAIAGRIRLSERTVAGFARTRDEARKINVSRF